MMQKADDLAQRARQLHFSSLVMDTHVDTVLQLQKPGWSFVEEHRDGHVDLPRLRKGGLNALFFSIYIPGRIVGPQAVSDALERIATVHRLVEDLPEALAFCTTAEQVHQARAQGKIAVLMGMEGGHMINNRIPILRMYAKLGVRYLTLTHTVNTDWADSSGDQPEHNGLTDFGKDVVRELNRLGMMVDISHGSDATFWDALAVSEAPLMASHSSCRAVADHARNLTDAMIQALADKGGVVQINYLDAFLDNELCAYNKKVKQRGREWLAAHPDEAHAGPPWEAIQAEFGPAPRASWERIIDHIDHAVRLVGVDHVGLGSDFDGATMPAGMEDASQVPKITEALVRRNYSDADIRKILGENTLRLMTQVEQVARRLDKSGVRSPESGVKDTRHGV